MSKHDTKSILRPLGQFWKHLAPPCSIVSFSVFSARFPPSAQSPQSPSVPTVGGSGGAAGVAAGRKKNAREKLLQKCLPSQLGPGLVNIF